MDRKETIRRQFDAQAKGFSNWSVTRNEEYMQAYFQFIGFQGGDELLDIACGTGEFSVFCAKRIKGVHGIDISPGVIELAQKLALENGLTNTVFECHDIEHIPCPEDSFSVVACKSAFHHMENYPRAFNEMLRCCKPGGLLTIQDIMAYEDPKVDSFIEAIEREVDASHNATLHRQDFQDLFNQNQVEVIRSLTVEIELSFREYLSHAVQSERSIGKIGDLLDKGLQDRDISQFLYVNEDDELILKRAVFLILGRKRNG